MSELESCYDDDDLVDGWTIDAKILDRLNEEEDQRREERVYRAMVDSYFEDDLIVTDEEAEEQEWERLLLSLTKQQQDEMDEPRVLGIRRAVEYQNDWCCFRENTHHRTTSTHKTKTLRTHRKGY